MIAEDASREYDVALSYAGEDREYVEAVALALRNRGLRVFYDRFEEADLIGRNLVDHLSHIYQRTARLCVVFISAAYARKPFTRLERQAAQARALEAEEPYIIPVRLDDTEIPGLLSTVAYVSGKTPEVLSVLIASKLMLREPQGFRLPSVSPRSDSVLVRFISAIEPDMQVFRETLRKFEHWAEDKLWFVPVEVRLPDSLQSQIHEARSFRVTESWKSPAISADAALQFSKFYDEQIPAFLTGTVKGVQTLVHHYNFAPEDRLERVVRCFLMTRMTTLCRLLLDWRLIGMPTLEWEPMFANFSHVRNEWVMYGLPYACFLGGHESYLWVDVDGRDTSTYVIWRQDRFRLYAPSGLLISKHYNDAITAEQFDRFFATQFLYEEIQNSPGQPLLYFAQYPDRLRLTIRGEWAIETEHFDQLSTSNFGGEPLFRSVRALRTFVVEEARRNGLSDVEQYLAVSRIRSLFHEGNQFDEILFPSDT
jgi:hypothetical protein